jgi:DNA-binding MarR family transcriptional regulator
MRIETFLEQSPLFEIYRVSRKLEAQLRQILGPNEISFFEALVLVSILFEEPHAVRPSHLAETFSTGRGNISNCISSLEARGLLKRRIDPEDGRSIQLLLKPPGRKCAMEAVRIFDQIQKQFEKKIGVMQLKAALSTVRDVERLCEEAVSSI